MNWDTLISAMVTGIFVGIGSTFGTWLVTRTFIKNLEKIENKLKEKNNSVNQE